MSSRAFIRFLEVGLGFTLGILQLEAMKDDISTTGMIIMNTILTSLMPTVMFRFEVTLYGKHGFSKIESSDYQIGKNGSKKSHPVIQRQFLFNCSFVAMIINMESMLTSLYIIDMLISSFAAWVYMVGGAFQYKYVSFYLTLYKACGSFIMACFFLIDLIVTWCSAADDEILIPNGVFFLIVARQEQWKVKDVRLLEDKMPITAPSTRVEPDAHYHRPRFMRPWGKAYFRVCDDEVAEQKLEDLLRKERKRRGKEALTPQERLLRAIEMKREIANALREQRIERAGRTISQNPSYR